MTEDADVKKGLSAKVFGGLMALVAFVAATGGFVYFRKGHEILVTLPPSTLPSVVLPTTPLTPPTPPPVVPVTPQTPVIPPKPVPPPVIPIQTTAFKNGTYSAMGTYFAPSGQESIGITLVLKDDLVTGAYARALATNPRSVYFQQQFVNNFASQVIGKKITGVSLDNVSGASLTPQGFNDAVAKIEAQAKA